MSARPKRSVIASIDGAGKSTVAQESALILSQAYPGHHISVVDSSGVYRFLGGALVEHKWAGLQDLEPHHSTSKLKTACRLGAFTLARRTAECWANKHSDVVIGVRDPYRIDPATYSLVFGPSPLRKLSATSRLQFFDGLALAPHPDLIIHLEPEISEVQANIHARAIQDNHETDEKMQIVADELPLILEGYSRLYGSQVAPVQALRPFTTDQVVAQLEPLTDSPPEPAYLPTVALI